MTVAAAAVRRISRAPGAIPTRALYAGLAIMIAAVFELGMLGIGSARPVFIACCLMAGYCAWRSSPAHHVEAVIVLFAVAPFLRRVVDASAGYEPSGYMLTGPILAMLLPAVELRGLLTGPRLGNGPLSISRLHAGATPYLAYALCVLYAAMVSLFQGDMMNAASGLLKWLAPVAYGLWLLHKPDPDHDFPHGAARALAVITPVIGAYGVLQYVAPPDWDRYWMIYAQMTSIGQPEPFQVRVFSTMNSPASFATYTACGLLLLGFARAGWQSILLALPGALGLLLSMYRTAWLALIAGILFCLLFAATRSRALLVLFTLGTAVGMAAVATPFGAAISDRLSTFEQAPSQDGSGQERLAEYVTLYNAGAATLVGSGFVTIDAGTPGQMPVDGQIIAAWLAMGLVVGLFSLAAILWVGGQALMQICRQPSAIGVALGAIVIGGLIQIPLAGMATAEIGVLFWVFAAIATAAQPGRGALAS